MKPTNGHTPYRHIRRRLVTRNKKSQGKWFKEGKKKEVISKMRIQLCRKEKFLFLLFSLSYLNVSGYSWSSTCYYTRTRVHNSSSHIIVSITSVATGVYAVAHVNICTIVCLPLIRIRMRNDYAWTPVFDKNKSKDKKKETKRSVTKYNSLSFWTYSIYLHELVLVFAQESKMTQVTLVEWGT